MPADEIKAVFDVIRTHWPKIISYDITTPTESVLHALSLFPDEHPHHAYISALKVDTDTKRVVWDKFADFSDFLIEILRTADKQKLRQRVALAAAEMFSSEDSEESVLYRRNASLSASLHLASAKPATCAAATACSAWCAGRE